jgi:WD40 repeat protein
VATGNFHDIDGQHHQHVTLAASASRMRVASASGTDHWLRLWQGDDRMRKVITRGPGAALAWSPDGRTIAVVIGKAVEFYDAQTGSRVAGPVTDEAVIRGVAFAPNGRLVTAGEATRIWERAGGVRVKDWPTSDHPSTGMALTPDGRTLLTCDGQQKLVRVLSVAEWCAGPAEPVG